MQARELNTVEKGVRKYQYNASGAVKKGRIPIQPAWQSLRLLSYSVAPLLNAMHMSEQY